jgi:transcriptional regulator with XRE-family HTH domain
MTGAELRAFIEQHGMTQEGFARLAGYSGRAVRMWLAGKKPVPRIVELFVMAVRRGELDPRDLST